VCVHVCKRNVSSIIHEVEERSSDKVTLEKGHKAS
jgi:hypothetical protein